VREGTTGRLVPVGDAAALAEAVRSVLDAPARADRMGRNARERAEQRFSVRATGERFLEVYDQLLRP
jgi:glycosyltransferase involved in cell wall biosynthesis